MAPLHNSDDQHQATQSWNKTTNAMSTLGFSTEEINGICSVLAAIFHLGNAGVMKGFSSL
jgi:myosin-18